METNYEIDTTVLQHVPGISYQSFRSRYYNEEKRSGNDDEVQSIDDELGQKAGIKAQKA